MSYFYGIYLQNTELSTALDLIRFLGEPDSIRFSHVTLRGPYEARLSKSWLSEINQSGRYDWRISLVKPDRFFAALQSTVLIRAHLGSLQELFHKPLFPKGVPHLTLYDGSERRFADGLYHMLDDYDWQQEVDVTPLREIGRKEKVDEVFLPFFMSFHKLFRQVVGDPAKIPFVKDMPADRRLDLIYAVLRNLRSDGKIMYRRLVVSEDNKPAELGMEARGQKTWTSGMGED
jgi:hypothetical protein